MILFCWCCHPPTCYRFRAINLNLSPSAVDSFDMSFMSCSTHFTNHLPALSGIWVVILGKICAYSVQSRSIQLFYSGCLEILCWWLTVTVAVTVTMVGSGGNGTAATLSGSDCTNMTNASALMLNWIMCLSDTCTKQPATWIDLTKLT